MQHLRTICRNSVHSKLYKRIYELSSLAEAGDKNLVIIGVDGISDALQAVKDGRLSASVLQDANGQASAVIDVAVKVGVGEEVESRYNVPFQLITADNVDDYLEWFIEVCE